MSGLCGHVILSNLNLPLWPSKQGSHHQEIKEVKYQVQIPSSNSDQRSHFKGHDMAD